MAYFEKRVNDEGVEELVEVDFNEMQIPDEVIFANPKVKAIAKRDIKRRKENERLKAALAPAKEDTEEDEVEDTEAEVTPPVEKVVAPVPLNEDELFEKFAQRLTAKQQAELDAKLAAETKLNDLIEKHSLTPDALPILANANDPAATAVLLEKAGFRYDDIEGGEVMGDRDDESLGKFQGASFKNIMKKTGLDKKVQ